MSTRRNCAEPPTSHQVVAFLASNPAEAISYSRNVAEAEARVFTLIDRRPGREQVPTSTSISASQGYALPSRHRQPPLMRGTVAYQIDKHGDVSTRYGEVDVRSTLPGYSPNEYVFLEPVSRVQVLMSLRRAGCGVRDYAGAALSELEGIKAAGLQDIDRSITTTFAAYDASQQASLKMIYARLYLLGAVTSLLVMEKLDYRPARDLIRRSNPASLLQRSSVSAQRMTDAATDIYALARDYIISVVEHAGREEMEGRMSRLDVSSGGEESSTSERRDDGEESSDAEEGYYNMPAY
jgi:hypothetical protein